MGKMSGQNLFGRFTKGVFLEGRGPNEPCVFVSYSSKDKSSAEKIAQYLMDKGLDIYFDRNDPKLQAASAQSDDEAIVKCIHDGLNHSTHALCLMSNNSVESQWVPYEVGYSVSRNHPLGLLLLSGVDTLPSFYKVARVLENQTALDRFILEISAQSRLVESRKSYAQLTSLAGIVRSSFQSVRYR